MIEYNVFIPEFQWIGQGDQGKVHLIIFPIVNTPCQDRHLDLSQGLGLDPGQDRGLDPGQGHPVPPPQVLIGVIVLREEDQAATVDTRAAHQSRM